MPHRGIRGRAFQRLQDAITYGMVLAYIGQPSPSMPVTDHTPARCKRNAEIRAQYAHGESLSRLAEAFGISPQRVHQIVHGRRK